MKHNDQKFPPTFRDFESMENFFSEKNYNLKPLDDNCGFAIIKKLNSRRSATYYQTGFDTRFVRAQRGKE
jgi:hypothetical protein